MNYKTLIYKKKDSIARITFNRPERLNAIPISMLGEFSSLLDEVASDTSLRVLILTGAGRAFCAGGDFKGDKGTPWEIIHNPEIRRPAGAHEAVRGYTKGTALKIQRLNIPVIAMVNGPAYGMGFDWALASDMRVGSTEARFGVAWLRRGQIPASATTWLLPRIVGMGRAAEIIFTARDVFAEEAERIGILNKLVPPEKLEEETLALAQTLADGAPISIKLCKINLYKGLEVDYETAMEYTAACQAIAFNTEDTEEGIAAFIEKRKPHFKGK